MLMKMNFSLIFEQGFLLRSTKMPINVVKVMHGVIHCVNSPLNLPHPPPLNKKLHAPSQKFLKTKTENSNMIITQNNFFSKHFIWKYSNYEKLKVNRISRISKYLVLFRRTILDSFKISCK